MASQDLLSNIDFRLSTAAIAITATGNGETIDTQGYDSVCWIINAGVFSNVDTGDFLTYSLEDDSASGMGTAAAVTGDEVRFADSWDGIINATDEDVAVYAMSYHGPERYVRMVITETSDTGNLSAIMSATCILGHAHSKPATAVAAA